MCVFVCVCVCVCVGGGGLRVCMDPIVTFPVGINEVLTLSTSL